jgi:2-polyprenyl-3-methyl-5-hydroxy-6-metoxy-1,4-benzoquinol methylase
MSKEFWDNRFSKKEFVFGTEPNQFFREQINKLKPGKILFAAEGEGRNAVYAAKLGWDVDAVDFSSSAKTKALMLAKKNKVNINYVVQDLVDYNFKYNFYDCVVMIFLHLDDELRNIVHPNIKKSLRKNGKLIIEVFNKEQINNSSGGPKNLDLLYDDNVLLASFEELYVELIENKTIELDEGNNHKGKADVVRFVGMKV